MYPHVALSGATRGETMGKGASKTPRSGRKRPQPIKCFDCGWTGDYRDLVSQESVSKCPNCSIPILNASKRLPAIWASNPTYIPVQFAGLRDNQMKFTIIFRHHIGRAPSVTNYWKCNETKGSNPRQNLYRGYYEQFKKANHKVSAVRECKKP
jgi:hypothetical protein